jgi:GxxExxY protein
MNNSYHRRITDTFYKAALNVQKKLGNCFTTQIYKDALEKEFAAENLPFNRNVQVPVFYGDETEPLAHKYMADFIIGGKIIVMVHGCEQRRPQEGYELNTMLRATNNKMALLVDFFEYNVCVSKAYSYTKISNSINKNENPLSLVVNPKFARETQGEETRYTEMREAEMREAL